MLLVRGIYAKPSGHWQDLAEEYQRRLTEQQIVPGNPGTILTDVETLIDFVGSGLATKSRNASFQPSGCLNSTRR